MPLALALARLALALAALAPALYWRSPVMASVGPLLRALAILLPLALLAIDAAALLARRDKPHAVRAIRALAVTAAAATLLIAAAREALFRFDEHEVRRAEPALVETIGRHIVVGYRDGAEIEDLVRRRAVAGVFVTARNVAGKTAEEIRQEIEAWQATRRAQGLPPLWIATDQEGGIVARLSPPLPRHPSLAEAIAGLTEAGARAAAARRYGETQGRELAALGINLNFAPVVDLNHRVVNPHDRYSRIYARAISHDPTVVTDAARHYCEGLAAAGVACTLKHFPGLGRVFEDTHVEAATLTASPADLAASDWVPFRDLATSAPAWPTAMIMLSHVRLAALDATRAASFSEPVVSGLLRGTWRYDGLLITDDFSMGAVYASPDGLPAASVAALNAGVDLILIAYDPTQHAPAMAALLRAARDGRLSAEVLTRSAQRLARSAPRAPH